MSSSTNSHDIVFALREHGQDIERAMADEMAVLAQMAVRTMQRLAPKSRSTLVTSISAEKVTDFEQHIGPTVNYAPYVEDGIKPGGKGLPRFFDPASASIVDWLKSHPRGGGYARPAAARGSKAFQAANLALRDRYQGLAWHIRHKGVKAQPFVEPTAKEMEGQMLQRLDLAVRRVLAARPADGGSEA